MNIRKPTMIRKITTSSRWTALWVPACTPACSINSGACEALLHIGVAIGQVDRPDKVPFSEGLGRTASTKEEDTLVLPSVLVLLLLFSSLDDTRTFPWSTDVKSGSF
jgi:hypothetical protein